MEKLMCKLCLFKVEDKESENCCTEQNCHDGFVKISSIAKEVFRGYVSFDTSDLICPCCEKKLREFYEFFRLVIKNQEKFVATTCCIEMFCPPQQKRKTQLEISEERKRKLDDAETAINTVFEMCCELCPMSPCFPTYHKLIQHRSSIHKKPKVWTCCGIKLWRHVNLVEHAKEHLNPYFCTFCGERFFRRPTFRKHLRACTKRPDTQYECAHCSRMYKVKSKVKHHLLSVHFKDLARPASTKRESSFPCWVCSKTYSKMYTLEQHVKYDHAEAPPEIECPVCGVMVRAKNYGLRSHIKQCHEEAGKTFLCPQCPRQFNKSRSLTKHITWAHTRGRTHVCNVCQKGFYTPAHLREHLSTHTGIPNYFCEYCCSSFKSNGNYYAHRRKVHAKELERERSQA